MQRSTYKLINFMENYSKDKEKYIVFIRLNSLGRNAEEILETLSTLQMSLEELHENPEYVIEEYNSRQDAWDRFNEFDNIKYRIDRWLLFQGILINSVKLF